MIDDFDRNDPSREERSAALSPRSRVARGAAFLDLERPGWADKVSSRLLDMQSCQRCILGQLFGDYFKGKAGLPVYAWEFGFTDFDDVKFDELHFFWLDEIEARTGG